MISDSKAFSSFSTDDIDAAEKFYAGTLGIDVQRQGDEGMGEILWATLPGGARLLIYWKADHEPASHTVLNFAVDDFESTVEELKGKGIAFERLEWTDDDGIARDPEGRMPTTAWFKDPTGNWICLLEADGLE
ncbi:VOC family protein [Demequina rhizosphaerae]|uniref:VOC family protein n=1 Tax=Demequina rhizosphaerae TaxID=1638985 RepID=UPI0007847D3C|nr:VOC family protein [Demequina rhizosphaerae]